jgi:CheY-like chemotaxis protein
MEHTALLPNRANTRPAPEPVSILVVDPHDDTRQLYRQCFELAECSVVEASDGRDALAKALEREPSLVVTELRLSFIDGIALCELLRLDPATSGVPVLVVTGENRPAEFGASATSRCRCRVDETCIARHRAPICDGVVVEAVNRRARTLGGNQKADARAVAQVLSSVGASGRAAPRGFVQIARTL